MRCFMLYVSVSQCELQYLIRYAFDIRHVCIRILNVFYLNFVNSHTHKTKKKLELYRNIRFSNFIREKFQMKYVLRNLYDLPLYNQPIKLTKPKSWILFNQLKTHAKQEKKSNSFASKLPQAVSTNQKRAKLLVRSNNKIGADI